MSEAVRVAHFPGCHLAVVRRRAVPGQIGSVIQEACGTVWKALQSAHITGGRHVTVYLDGNLNLEVGVELQTPIGNVGEVVASALPAGEVATVAHFGPYAGLPEAHEAIGRWCAANGRGLGGMCWEVYGHWEDAWNREPGLIRTDVYYLLRA